MKKISILIVIVIGFLVNVKAQFMETGVMPPENGKTEEFTEWKKVEFTINSQNLSYEYRIAFQKRKALACNYELQVKNTSTVKISFKVKTHYEDLLVKGSFGDEFKELIKPDNTVSFLIITQGCKADKEKEAQEDFDRCRNHCGLSYEIYSDVD
jgi:hypothetical protein